ncbi:hypothetical protein [Prochlorococcus marinus]|uniref:hypothetical protein n=1 Tax=Prochlorococcus marinus TaxID=1219 RepID=UPI000517A981|nr:hypothetical protein [Prochlorococcus marinus]KGF90576.1 hypothetical protein EU92_0948 [Prochlorococcus marinus str. MIT 9107]
MKKILIFLLSFVISYEYLKAKEYGYPKVYYPEELFPPVFESSPAGNITCSLIEKPAYKEDSKQINKLRTLRVKAETDRRQFRKLKRLIKEILSQKDISDQELSEATFIRGWTKMQYPNLEIQREGYRDIVNAHNIYPLSNYCSEAWNVTSYFHFYAYHLSKEEGRQRACDEALKVGNIQSLSWLGCDRRFGDKYYLGIVLGKKYGEKYFKALETNNQEFLSKLRTESNDYLKRRDNFKLALKKEDAKEERIKNNDFSISEGSTSSECSDGRKNYNYTFQTGGGLLSKRRTKTITLECLTPLEIAQIKTGITDLNKLKKQVRGAQISNALIQMGNAIQRSTMQRTINGLQYRQITGY